MQITAGSIKSHTRWFILLWSMIHLLFYYFNVILCPFFTSHSRWKLGLLIFVPFTQHSVEFYDDAGPERQRCVTKSFSLSFKDPLAHLILQEKPQLKRVQMLCPDLCAGLSPPPLQIRSSTSDSGGFRRKLSRLWQRHEDGNLAYIKYTLRWSNLYKLV